MKCGGGRLLAVLVLGWSLVSEVAAADFTKAVTFTVAGVDEGVTLKDFPVLVRLSSTSPARFNYSGLDPTGADMAFYDMAGHEIPHEIDTWNPSGTSFVWVKVPSVFAGATFEMRYGGGVSGALSTTATWSDYAGVWHMNETSGTTTLDATANGLNGANGTDNAPCTDGQIGAARFMGPHHRASSSKPNGTVIPYAPALDVAPVFSISGWYRFTVSPHEGYGHLFSRFRGSDIAASTWDIQWRNGCWAVSHGNGIKGLENTTTEKILASSATGTWHQVTVVFDAAGFSGYIDGERKSRYDYEANSPHPSNGTVADPNPTLAIGTYDNGTKNDWGGLQADIDEVRLSGTAFNPAWVKADYATQTDASFLTAGEIRQIGTEIVPEFRATPTLVKDGTVYRISGAFEGSADDRVSVVYTAGDTIVTHTPEVTGTDGAFSFTDSSEGLAAGTYRVSVKVMNANDRGMVQAFADPICTGMVTLEAVKDADEKGLMHGSFELKRPALGAATPLTVAYAVGGTATAGADYETLPGTVTFAAGETTATIVVTPLASLATKSDTTVVVTLADGNWLLPEADSQSIAIKNDPGLKSRWRYNTTYGTLSRVRESEPTIVISNVTATSDLKLTIGDNTTNPLAYGLDFSVGIEPAAEGGWDIVGFTGSAFAGCAALKGGVVLPSTVTEISDSAFKQTAITSITAPGLKKIGKGAFQECKSLTDITGILGEGLESIGEDAFRDAQSVRGDIVLPNSLTSVGGKAFAAVFRTGGETSKGTITFGTGLTTLGSELFSYSYYLSGDLVIPKNITSIPTLAFGSDATGEAPMHLTSVVMEGGCVSIGARAFRRNHSLVRVVLSPETKSIDKTSFLDCRTLKTIYIDHPLETYDNAMNDNFGGGDHQVTYIINPKYASEWQAFAEKNANFTLPSDGALGAWKGSSRTQDVKWGKRRGMIILAR